MESEEPEIGIDFEEEHGIRLELVSSPATITAEASVKNICLVCMAGVTDEVTTPASIGEGDQNHRRERLKTFCELLQVGSPERILESIDRNELMFRQILFCQNCLSNVDDIKNLQTQLTELTIQIGRLRDAVCNTFAEAAMSTSNTQTETGLLDEESGSELRRSILSALFSEIKEEPITLDDDDTYPNSPGYVDLFLANDNEDEAWSPSTSMEPETSYRSKKYGLRRSKKRRGPMSIESSPLTKPCEVRIARLAGDDPGTLAVASKRSKLSRLILSQKNTMRAKSSKKRITELKRKWEAVVKTEANDPDDSASYSLAFSPQKIKKEIIHSERTMEFCPIAGCTENIHQTQMGYHIRQVHQQLPNPFNCLACEAEFKTHPELRKHIRTEHEMYWSTKRKKPNTERKPGNVKCIKCEQKFNCYRDLVMHFRRQGGECSKQPLPPNCTVKVETAEKPGRHVKIFSCGTCQKTFNRRYLLDIHIKGNHLGFHPYLCEICCKSFKRENSLHLHQRMRHPEEYRKAFNIDEQKFMDDLKSRHCDICNKTFINVQAKKGHDVFHSQDYQFRCQTCGFGTTNRKNLELHQLKHSGVKDFPCNECNFRFNRLDKLTRHLTRVHKVGDSQKSFLCDFCPKTFWDKFALTRHQRIMHREEIPKEEAPAFECKICNYKCPDKGYLGIHYKTKRHKDKAARLEITYSMDEEDEKDPLFLPDNST